MTTPPTDTNFRSPLGVLTIHRGQLVAVAVIGLILGLIGLFFPRATLLTVAILFGIYLVASGIFRFTAALVAQNLSTGARWLTGVLGILVVIAGIICLSNPFRALIVLAFVIGIGWVAEGILDLMAGIQGSVHPRWIAILSGVVSLVAGIIVFVLPAAGVATFVFIAAIMLIAVSLTTLLTLPRRAKTSA
jgi:uncharacterized membrane protein HdeD (DUF308 family)